MPFSKTKADNTVKFIETHCRHTDGEWYGKPFILEPFQKKPIRDVFGTMNEDGFRQYRTVFKSTGRKQGKTEEGAAIALKLLCADGEKGAQVVSAAGDREQASLCFNVAAKMVELDPELSAALKVNHSTKNILFPKTGSFYRAISAEAYSKHGYNLHGIIFDELHTQPSRDLWDVLTTSRGARRQPLIWAMTTAGYDRNSICWEVYQRAKKVLADPASDPTFYPAIWEVPEDADWMDRENWKLANPASFRKWSELDESFANAMAVPSYENTFRRLFLNQWTQQDKRWLPMDLWRKCGACIVHREDLAGRYCYAGLDLSSTTDLSALVLVFPWEDGVAVIPFFWMPEAKLVERSRRDRADYVGWQKSGFLEVTPGNVIDYSFIRQRVRELSEEFSFQEIGYDRWNATQIILELGNDGFKMSPVGQGYQSMSPAAKELERLVVGGKLYHNANPVLEWMANNVVAETDAAGNIKPNKGRSADRIDGIAALCVSLNCLMAGEGVGQGVGGVEFF